jgi:hypothetical protein
MSKNHMRELFNRYQKAAAYISVRDDIGEVNIGSAFHAGEGVYVTAKHVLEGREIVEVGTGGVFTRLYTGEVRGPYFHSDPGVDVAAIVLRDASNLPSLPFGSHLDDWINDDAFVLSEAMILGYPPIPLTGGPYLVAARAEVNAVVDIRATRHVHFILSAMPRGGFSGAVVLSEWDFVLGIVTRSLLKNSALEELGFLTVLSIEPIYECLRQNGILPAIQDESWHADYDAFHGRSVSRELDVLLMTSTDERGMFIQIDCSDKAILEMAIAAVTHIVSSVRHEIQYDSPTRIRVKFPDSGPRHRAVVASGVSAAQSALKAAGLKDQK